MITQKQGIKCADFETAIRKAIRQVDELKHATPMAKKEVYDILMKMHDDLITYEDKAIEIPHFMREIR